MQRVCNKAVHLANRQAVRSEKLEADVEGFDVELDCLFIVSSCMAFAAVVEIRHTVAIAAARSKSVKHLREQLHISSK
jgi:hypothetical protein